MNIQQRLVGDVVVLAVLGDITMNGSEAPGVADAVRRVIQEGHTRLVLDLGHVRYVDSAGLGDLVQAQSAARNRSGAVKLVKVSKRLNDLLLLTKLTAVFDCFDGETEALASFEQSTVPH